MDPKDQTTWPWKQDRSVEVYIGGEMRRLVAELAQQPDGWWIRVVTTHGDRHELTKLFGPYKSKQMAQMVIGPAISYIRQRLSKDT